MNSACLLPLVSWFIFSSSTFAATHFGSGTVTFTSDTLIDCGETTFDGMDIVVDGATVTINCAHSFASLQLLNGATVTHQAQLEEGCDLSIAGDLTVDFLSRFDGNARGYWVGDLTLGSGPGGGETPGTSEQGAGAGHGGAGSNGFGGTRGGSSYGSHEFPGMLGSSGTNTTGGRGGGRFKLTVGGRFLLAGSVQVNGDDGSSCCGGGGSGGSIWIDANLFEGSGTLQARGGTRSNDGGGGGGGRIAVHYAVNAFSGEVQTYGGQGTGNVYGGAGTYYQRRSGSDRGVLLIDAERPTSAHANTEFDGPTVLEAIVLVRRGARIGPSYEQTLDLTVDGDLVIESSARLYADGRGFPSSMGPGRGLPSDTSADGSGASHGGRAYVSRDSVAANLDVYGDPFDPSELGSGGGYRNGGAGGGAVMLTVNGDLFCEGTISANGFNGGESRAGGGSGGSVNIRTGGFFGSGTIQARGGNGSGDGGGGGGGRIAIRYETTTFSDDGLRASGGSIGWASPFFGGAGTVYREDLTTGGKRLIFDNFGAANSVTRIDGRLDFDGDVLVRRLARVQPVMGQRLDIVVGGDLTIEGDGRIDADALGFVAVAGPGAGQPSSTTFDGSGGSHGGAGRESRDSVSPLLNVYGSAFEPDTMGSGGGRSNGGSGGGIVRLDVAGELLCDGVIASNGQNGLSAHGGGGAGGSVNIRCTGLSGGGQVQANGGNGSADGGGGGGGRIAVRYSTSSLLDDALMAGGGSIGWSSPFFGGCGTIYREDESSGWSELLIDGLGRANGLTYVNQLLVAPVDLRIRGLAEVVPDAGVPAELRVGRDLILEADGAITADGLGFARGEGPGAGLTNSFPRGTGGSHGGFGAICATGLAPSPTYGSFATPVNMGSGGGQVNGGAGGGAWRLDVAGTCRIDGRISVNGANSLTTNGGGGAGGSVFVTCSAFAGDSIALIRANGGNATAGSSGSGAGGGGRLAVHYLATSFEGSLEARGGDDDCTPWGGAGTIYMRDVGDDSNLLVVDGGNVANQGTGFLSPTVLDGALEIRNQGKVQPPARSSSEQPVRLDLTVTGDLVVDATSSLDVAGLGFAPESGPGAGVRPLGQRGSGGGHGGTGGDSSTGSPGGVAYGSDRQPVTFGSGGGDQLLGGMGGGALRLSVDGDLFLDGLVDARGLNAVNGEAGGGAGGSILITGRSLAGTGLIRANGGIASGSGSGGGGGAGGRIAIYTECDPEFGFGTVQALAGTGDGAASGEVGSIYLGYQLPEQGEIALSSSDAAQALAFDGTLIQQVFTANNGAPAFDPANWQPVLRKEDEYVARGFSCDPLGAYETEGELELIDPPVSTVLSVLESSGAVRVFREGDAVTLTAPLVVDTGDVGRFNELSDLSPATIPTGTRVISHLVHFDPSGTSVAALVGSVQFDGDIIGLVALDATLDATDMLLGSAGTMYPFGLSRRGIDFGDATETLIVSPDRRSLTWSTRASGVLDQLRVLVRVEEPLSMPFLDATDRLIGENEITLDNCSSFFVRFTFDMPVGFSNPVLTALVNADDQAVAYLNGHKISGRMTTPPPGCDTPDPSLGPNDPCYSAMDAGSDVFDVQGRPILTWPTQDCIRTDRFDHFRPGTNELVFAVVGSASYWNPVGLEFRGTVSFDDGPATIPGAGFEPTGPVREAQTR